MEFGIDPARFISIINSSNSSSNVELKKSKYMKIFLQKFFIWQH